MHAEFRNRDLCSIPSEGSDSFLPLSFGILPVASHISYPKGTKGCSRVSKGTGVCTRPTPLTSFEFKNTWRYTFTPRWCFTTSKARLTYLPPLMPCDITWLCISIRTVVGTTVVAQLFKKSPWRYEIRDFMNVYKIVLRARKYIALRNIRYFKVMCCWIKVKL